MRFLYLLAGLFFLSLHSLAQNVSRVDDLLKIDQQGKIAYNTFPNAGEADAVNTIPDYSYAGYKGGGVAIPDVDVKQTLSPTSGDQTKRIQNAIDAVSKLPLDKTGFRGRVLLRKGVYDVNGTLQINTSGVVLSGEGQGEDQTIIRATKKNQQILIGVGVTSTVAPIKSTKKQILDDIVPTGAKTFQVNSGGGFKKGDTIFIQKTPNQAWIKKIGMSGYGWKPEAYQILHERIITAISGNKITINIPVVDPIYKKYGGGAVYKANINRKVRQVGVENLRLVSTYASETDEKHGWEAVKIRSAEHCWVRKVTAQYFGQSCVTIMGNAVFTTVEDCAMLDPKSKPEGGKRYSFNIVSGSFNLFQRCYTRSGRHDFVTGAKVPGPNVFLDCFADAAKADTGPHQRWATGLLFDNVYANSIRVINAKANGTGHGWTGSQTMLWNCEGNKIEVQVPPTGMNWNVNTRSANLTSGKTFLGKVVNQLFSQTTGQPRSLYLKQLEDRLGTQAVNNITTSSQRNGSLFTFLKNWKGG